MNSVIMKLAETAETAAENASADSGTDVSVMLRLLCGLVGILLLVYILAEVTPKLAAFIDKTLGKSPPPPERVEEKDYKVYDFYSGEAPTSENTDEADKNK